MVILDMLFSQFSFYRKWRKGTWYLVETGGIPPWDKEPRVTLWTKFPSKDCTILQTIL